ncbi:MAG: helix-turn-helix domain-containing protein [Steroidobacteraceae bacterium]
MQAPKHSVPTLSPALGVLKGLLTPGGMDSPFQHGRKVPSGDLGRFVEHFWTVAWDLRDKPPVVVETLPHPCVYLIIEDEDPERTGLAGINPGRFTREIQGRGRVIGTKFRPAMFHPFFNRRVSELRGRVVSLPSVFGRGGGRLVRSVLSEPDTPGAVLLVENFLTSILPPPNRELEALRDAVERISTDRSIVRVEQLASITGTNLRRLQRNFSEYVGIGPKWVIRRYRLHEAAQRLIGGAPIDMPDLALRLGYFDQAHLIRDFRAAVGKTPAEFAKLCGNSSRAAPQGRPRHRGTTRP